MTQEQANKIFATELGQQLNKIFVTSDDKPFIRYEEALKHSNGELDEGTRPLTNKSITVWYNEH